MPCSPGCRVTRGWLGKPLRAVIEEGLRRVLEAASEPARYQLPDRSVGKTGETNPLAAFSWWGLGRRSTARGSRDRSEHERARLCPSARARRACVGGVQPVRTGLSDSSPGSGPGVWSAASE